MNLISLLLELSNDVSVTTAVSFCVISTILLWRFWFRSRKSKSDQTGSVLVLGGGKCGLKLAYQIPNSYVTHRTQKKVEETNGNGRCKAVQFLLHDESSWKNLPIDSVKAVVITFALSWEEDSQMFQKLFKSIQHLPIILYSTTSVYGGLIDHKQVLTEESPLNGVGVTGKPMADRAKMEEWVRQRGAVVLTLSGISFGDDDKMRGILNSGYIKHGYALVNYVHVLDVIAVTEIMLRLLCEESSTISGERYNVTSGAYRWRDFAKELDLEDQLPGDREEPPSCRSKIVSHEKLMKVLPNDFQWRSPISCPMSPISCGMPTGDHTERGSSMVSIKNGAGHDRQWNLMVQNFEGKWNGQAHWFERSNDSGIISFQEASTVRSSCTLHISFIDRDHGTWHGTGLRFAKDGEKILHLSRPTYNPTGGSFMFLGVGAQISLTTNRASVFAQEINFFIERARTMLITIYKPDDQSWKLSKVSVTPFRCLDGSNFPIAEKTSIQNILKQADGLSGTRQGFSANLIPSKTVKEKISNFDSEAFLKNHSEYCVQTFMDGSFIAVPTVVSIGGNANLKFGTFHSYEESSTLRIVTVFYQNGETSWTLDEFKHEIDD